MIKELLSLVIKKYSAQLILVMFGLPATVAVTDILVTTAINKVFDKTLDQAVVLKDNRLNITSVNYNKSINTVTAVIKLSDYTGQLNSSDIKITDTGVKIKDFKIKKLSEINVSKNILFIIDESGSMAGEPKQRALDSFEYFLNNSSEKYLANAVVFEGFSEKVLENSTLDKSRLIKDAKSKVIGDADSGSALIGSIELGIDSLDQLTGRKYIVIFADGDDNISKYREPRVLASLKKLGITVYSIGFKNTETYDNDTVARLKRLSSQTGGFFIELNNFADLNQIMDSISKSNDSEYQITYALPDQTTKDRTIKAQLSLNIASFDVRGYVADYNSASFRNLGTNDIKEIVDAISAPFKDIEDPDCVGEFDETKKYDIKSAAEFIASNLVTGPDYTEVKIKDKDGKETSKRMYYYSQFKCKKNPFTKYLPEKVREIYTWSTTWHPDTNQERYVQCVAFVHMVYNMVKDPIKLERGNAIAFAGKGYNKDGVLIDVDTYKDQFEVYKDGETTELPKVGDLMVWEEFAPYGHVGVVTDVDEVKNQITIINGNSVTVNYIFKYYTSDEGKINLDSKRAWRPYYWTRKK